MTLMLAQREKNRLSTVNQRETHFTDSRKKTFRQTTVNQAPGRTVPPPTSAPAPKSSTVLGIVAYRWNFRRRSRRNSACSLPRALTIRGLPYLTGGIGAC